MSELLFVLAQALKFGSRLNKQLKKTPAQKRRKAMLEFDGVMAEVQDPEKPSTRGLEKWLSENLD